MYRNLTIQFCDLRRTYFCTDDTYDGAPDAGRQNVGEGNTELSAIEDYYSQITKCTFCKQWVHIDNAIVSKKGRHFCSKDCQVKLVINSAL